MPQFSCHSEVYVHNYTRDITATRPENFAALTEEEKALIKKLGVYIKAGGLGATRFFFVLWKATG